MPDAASVEVLISDNASTDDTFATVQSRIGNSRLRLTYYRNERNLGFDGNILEIYRKASGQYVWFMADDDRIEYGGIRALIRHLGEIEPCGIVANNTRGGLLDCEYSDLVTYSPNGDKVCRRVGVRTAVSNERERLAAIMTISQISTCIVRRYESDFKEGPGGGHMHERLANLSLLRTPYYFVIPEPIIAGGPTYWSFWFMDAVIYGIRELYTAPDMEFSREMTDLVTTQTSKVGLRLMAMRYWRPLEVDYPEIDDDMIERIKRAYGDAYVLIEHDVRKAVLARKHKKRDRFLFILICPVYFVYKAWQILALPNVKRWMFLLRARLITP